MHELGIMTGVMESVRAAALNAQALRVTQITLDVGVMTEAIEDALMFSFDCLKEDDPLCKDAELVVNMLSPMSTCEECGQEYMHDRFHVQCPNCGSFDTLLIQGRELQIKSIEVDLPETDEEKSQAEGLQEN